MSTSMPADHELVDGNRILDQNNNLLKEVPVQVFTAVADTPNGQRMVFTVRTETTTLTVLLNAKAAKAWAANVTYTASQMSDSGLQVMTTGAQATCG